VKKNYDDMLSRFHLIPEHHGRTDRQTDLLYQYRASVLITDTVATAKKTETRMEKQTQLSIATRLILLLGYYTYHYYTGYTYYLVILLYIYML